MWLKRETRKFLVTLFLYVNILFYGCTRGQGSCNSLLETCDCPPFDTAAANFYAHHCAQPTGGGVYIPPRVSNPPTTILDTVGHSTFYGTTHGYSITRIQNLYYGAVYEFSTCDRSTSTPYDYANFETILVLYDPYGNLISANENCVFYESSFPAGKSCSYVTYNPNDVNFNEVYVVIYRKEVSKSDGSYICASQSSLHSATAGIYVSVISVPYPGDPTCKVSLTCVDSLTYDVGDFIAPFIWTEESNYDTCNYDPNYLSAFIGDTEFYLGDDVPCSVIGENVGRVSAFGETCTFPITVHPPSPSVSCRFELQYIYPTPYLTTCRFEGVCAFDTTVFPVDVIPYSFCPTDFTVVYSPEDTSNINVLGNTVGYSVEVIDQWGLTASASCSAKYLGIQPTSLVSYNDQSTLIHDGDTIYFDTPYFLYSNAYLPPNVDYSIAIGFYTGGENELVTNPSIYLVPDFKTLPDCEGDCQVMTPFCIPSLHSPFSPGFYNIVNYVDLRSPLSGPAPYLPGVSEVSRDVIPTYLISLGNPKINLAYNPKESAPKCSDYFIQNK